MTFLLATAESAEAGVGAARRTEPAVVLVDYELPRPRRFDALLRAEGASQAPGVVVDLPVARPGLLPAAAVAGTHSMLDKAAPTEELFETIRSVARGEGGLPAPAPEVVERSFSLVDTDDIVLFGMAANGARPDEIAAVAGNDPDETRRQLRALLARLQATPAERKARSASELRCLSSRHRRTACQPDDRVRIGVMGAGYRNTDAIDQHLNRRRRHLEDRRPRRERRGLWSL